MKQTAVQWLVEKYVIVMGLGSKELMKEHIERAKEMEREQIEDAFQTGKWDWHRHVKNGLESQDCAQYYNETFNTK